MDTAKRTVGDRKEKRTARLDARWWRLSATRERHPPVRVLAVDALGARGRAVV